MKVSELIERLQREDPDAEVHHSYSYGDYWRTTVAPIVRRVDEAFVEYSEYHSMPKLADDEDAENDPNQPTVVMLS
jgi:hypothetical protein